MRKLKVTTFLTLDGVMQAPGGPEEDPSGGFAHGGWSVKYWDDRLSQEMTEFMGRPFDMVLGRKTLRDLRGVLAALDRARRGRPEQGAQARRLDDPAQRGLEQLHTHQRRRWSLRSQPQERVGARDPG